MCVCCGVLMLSKSHSNIIVVVARTRHRRKGRRYDNNNSTYGGRVCETGAAEEESSRFSLSRGVGICIICVRSAQLTLIRLETLPLRH